MKILLVDDSTDFKSVFKGRFEPDHEIDDCSTVTMAINLLITNCYDLIIVDWMLPFESASRLVKYLHENKHCGSVLIYTGLPKESVERYSQGFEILIKGQDDLIKFVKKYNERVNHHSS